MKSCALALLVATAAPVAARQKRLVGKISDPAAFARITSYCVDPSDLPSDQAYDVRGFVQTEGKPGKLLAKLPWKLLPDCRENEPETLITLEFPRQHVIALGGGGVSNPTTTNPEDQTAIDYHTVAILRVFDAGSRRLLYEVQAQPLNSTPITNPNAGEVPSVARHDAMYGAFWTLINDVALVSRDNKR